MCLVLFLTYILFILFLSALIYPLPVNDSGVVRYRTVPWATIGLIAINTIIFMAWLAPDLYRGAVDENVGLVPTDSYMGKINTYGFSESTVGNGQGIGALATFSAMFMHADMWHLIFNMVYLWTFGRRVEDACGSWRFLLFYLGAGMLANLGSVLFNPALDSLPGIGASGAISGVMGAYLFLFPGTRVMCLWGIGLIVRLPIAAVRKLIDSERRLWRWTLPVPAWLLLIWYLIQNTLPSLETIRSDHEISGVNHLAHLAGFFGALLIFLYVRKDLLLRYISGRAL